MTSTVDNWKVVYLRLITSELENDTNIIELAARFEEKEFSKWITPSIEKLWNFPKIERYGLKIKNGALFRDGRRLETIDLMTALMTFHEFVTSLQGPVLLVTYSSRSDMMSLFNAIQRTDMVDVFRGVIERVTNTLAIFAKVFPKLVTTNPLTLDQLIKSVLKISTRGKYLESQFYLECLAELIIRSSISTAELIENSESYEKVVLSVPRPSRSWVSNRYSKFERSFNSNVRRRHRNSEASNEILKELSRKHDYTKFHEYLDKQYITNVGCKIRCKYSMELFHIFNEINEREDEDHVSTSDLVELNAAGPSRIPDAPARYSNDHLANRGQQNVGSDVTISLVDDVEVPRYDKSYPFNKQQGELNAAGPSRISSAPARYNDYQSARGQQQQLPYEIRSLVDELETEYNTNYSPIRDEKQLVHDMEIQGKLYDNEARYHQSYPFNKQQGELNAAGGPSRKRRGSGSIPSIERKMPARVLPHSSIPEYIKRRGSGFPDMPARYNDYPPARGRQHHPHGIYSLVDELPMEYNTNYSFIRDQEELGHDKEIQEHLYDSTYQFTGEQKELINELASIMGQEEPCNNDYSLTRGQQQELPYGVHSLVEELATEYVVNYSPIREQEEIVRDIERQEALYSNDYPSTRHQKERNADARSSMGEWYFPINQDQRDQEFDPFHQRNYQQK